MRLNEIVDLDELDEATSTGSSGGVKPLTPAQARVRAKKTALAQQQMRDENQRHAAKIRALRGKLVP